MKGIRIAGMTLLLIVWIWLCQYLLRYGGFNLKNLLIAGFSGVAIFLPLYRKYFVHAKENEKK